MVFHAGDWVNADLLDAMEDRSARLVGCWGNNDGPARERLPERADVTLAGVRFTVVHETGPAAGREARMAARHPDTDVLIFGHSHIPGTPQTPAVCAAESRIADRPPPTTALHLHDRRGRRITRRGRPAPATEPRLDAQLHLAQRLAIRFADRGDRNRVEEDHLLGTL